MVYKNENQIHMGIEWHRLLTKEFVDDIGGIDQPEDIDEKDRYWLTYSPKVFGNKLILISKGGKVFDHNE